MPRGPIWTIFILMSASIVTAALYHTYTLSKAGERGPRPSLTWGLSASQTVAQMEADCSNDRLYFENELSRLAPIYRETRWRRNQDYPYECITLGLTNTARISPGTNHYWCLESGLGEVKKPCVSPTLVNVVDNLVGDVTDCFDLPSREFLAVAAQRALLPMNCMKGVSSEKLDSDYLLQSEKISCQRVNSLAKLRIASAQKQDSCAGLAGPFVPLIQLGFELHQIQVDFEKQWRETDHQVEQLGFDESQRQQLRAWSYFLSVEAGVDSAIAMTDRFLQSLGEETPGAGRSLSSIKSPGEINLRGAFLTYLRTKLHKDKFNALERIANWIEISQPLKGQCVPDAI